MIISTFHIGSVDQGRKRRAGKEAGAWNTVGQYYVLIEQVNGNELVSLSKSGRSLSILNRFLRDLVR